MSTRTALTPKKPTATPFPALMVESPAGRRAGAAETDRLPPTTVPEGYDFSRIAMRSEVPQATEGFRDFCPLSLATPRTCPFGGVCHLCPARVQAKYAVSQGGDQWEREADQVAEQILEMPNDGLEADFRTDTAPSPSPGDFMEAAGLEGSGAPLSPEVREFFEPRFGCDLTGVRLHTGPQASGAARSLGARAFTLGREIVFGAGEYNPHSAAGRRILAHELVHTLQQSPGAMSPVGMAAGLHPTPGLMLSRIRCLNPDICAAMTTQRTCLPISCGWGRSGICRWLYGDGCCCMGAQRREPAQETRLRELLPAWVLLLLSVAALAAIAACFASGVCEAAMILGLAGAAAAAVIIVILEGEGVEVTGQEA